MMIKLFAIAVAAFFTIDMVWLGLIAKNFYANQIGFLMKSNINWTAAIIFYFLFVLGLVVFVILPAIKSNSFKDAILYGGLFGLVTYSTYDLTNLAVIKNWPLTLTLVDLAWGTFLAASVSAVTFFVYHRLS